MITAILLQRGVRLTYTSLILQILIFRWNIIVQRAVAVAECGLFDGHSVRLVARRPFFATLIGVISIRYSTKEDELQARLSIVQRIRDQVRDDFLIIGNTNRRKIPVTAPYLNGGYMETGRDHDLGYTYDGL